MFILTVTYTVPLDQVDPHVPPHMDWVNEGYERGLFLASGRKTPRTGGVILAKGERAEIEEMIARDPFVTANVGQYEIAEIAVSRTIDGLEALAD